MRQELDKELCKLAPYLFGDRHTDMRKTALCWGFDVGDGWFPLLKEAALKLEPLCKAEYYKYASLEKPWYKHIRTVLYKMGKTKYLFSALYWLANRLVPNLNNPINWHGGGPRASQIKEKYGTLRFYMTHATDEMYAIIAEIEKQSAKICEECGEPGKLRGQRWYYTRCAACWKRMEK